MPRATTLFRYIPIYVYQTRLSISPQVLSTNFTGPRIESAPGHVQMIITCMCVYVCEIHTCKAGEDAESFERQVRTHGRTCARFVPGEGFFCGNSFHVKMQRIDIISYNINDKYEEKLFYKVILWVTA